MEKTLKERMREDMQLRGLQPSHAGDVPHAGDAFRPVLQEAPGQARQEGGEGVFPPPREDKHASYGVLNMTYCALKFIYNAQRIIMRREGSRGPPLVQ